MRLLMQGVELDPLSGGPVIVISVVDYQWLGNT